MHAQYRLGLDLGTNSIGWCVLDLDRNGKPRGIRRLGVRIFPDGRDPQSGASLAEERRVPRGQRRRRDRYLDRRADLMKALIRHGLMPADPVARKALECLDPYELRTKGLDEKLPLHHLGRAIFHLNQRRGFQSNRKTDKGKTEKEAKEAVGMKAAIESLDERITESEARTLGEYLYRTRRENRTVRGKRDADGNWIAEPMRPVRARPAVVKGRNAYDLYPSRAMYRQEFDALWAAQARHHPELNEEARTEIAEIVFFQRKLRPVEPGRCTLDPAEPRAPLALPIVSEFRILQELANLRLEDTLAHTERRLTLAERDGLAARLRTTAKLTFAAIRKALNLPAHIKINLEEARRDSLKGDAVSAHLARDNAFGARWQELPEATQTKIVLELLDEPDETALLDRATREWGLTETAARAVADAPLPEDYGRVSLAALRRIVPIMRDQTDEKGGPLHYDEAARRAGYDHAEWRTGEILDEMPYYGEILSRYVAPVKSSGASPEERDHGRIANPTVHIGLNQLRKLVNALITQYGPPAEIVVELARDLKLSREQKEKIRKEQAENTRKNEQRRQKLEEISRTTWTDGLLRLRLWEELAPEPHARACVYTGKPISIEKLFSDEIEIDHILPFRTSLDDSPANKIVCYRQANRDKRKRSPHEAFHKHPGYDWDGILRRAGALPANKRWRFRPDALELVTDRARRDLARLDGHIPQDVLDDMERTGGFLARQLVDTAYLARVARQYLASVCDPAKVRVTPGRMTELLRRHWKLNRLLYGNRPEPDDADTAGFPSPFTPVKRRDDHRHHAIDAFVVGMTDLGLLQRVSTAAGRSERRLLDDLDAPWPGFYEQLKEKLDRMIVSHKPDHGAQGRLHEATAYGIVKDPEREGGATVVYRKALVDLSEGEIQRIRDQRLREQVLAATGLAGSKVALQAAQNALKAARKSKDEAATQAAKAAVDREKAADKQRKKEGKKDLQSALQAFAGARGIRRVRLRKAEEGLVLISRNGERPYKAVSAGDNHRVEIFARSDGSWGAEIVTVFSANRKDFRPRWRADPAAQLVFAFHKNDLIKLRVDGQERIMRVVSIWERYLQLAGHWETNFGERYRDGTFKWTFANYDKLAEMQARKVTVDLLGRVNDPGPQRSAGRAS